MYFLHGTLSHSEAVRYGFYALLDYCTKKAIKSSMQWAGGPAELIVLFSFRGIVIIDPLRPQDPLPLTHPFRI